ncbi:MAG TPA: tetratricopeptide repeat protein [Pararobbsia sp.]|nr:tetratricopeptide repeat protein [Pararobbsia sp.]
MAQYAFIQLDPAHFELNVLREAYAAHQRGRLAEAERGYLAALQQSPDEVDALHLLGVLRHQQGRHADAVELLRRAVALRPRFAGAHLNLGNAWKALRQFDEAQASYRAALAVQPDFAHAHFNLANTLVTLEHHEEAIEHFEQAVRLQPTHAAAFNNLGNSLAAVHRHEAAAGAFYKAIQLQPGYAGAHNNLGLALNALGQHDEALDQFRKALATEPHFTLARFNLGTTLDKLNRSAEAIEPLEHVTRAQPGFAPAHYALGNAYANVGRLADAHVSLDTAVSIDPSFALAWQDLGTVAYDLGDYAKAGHAFDTATHLRPDLALAQYNRGLVALMCGDFERGFDAYEWRWNVWPRPTVTAPPWRGGALPETGNRLLVHAEQGLGDTIQFIRYIPRLVAAGADVVLEVQPPLVKLFAPSAQAWGVELIERGAPRPPVDAECPLLSLPLALGTGAGSIPRNVPYVMAPGLAGGVANTTRKRVGIVWSGAIRARRETRAIPVSALTPLFRVDEIDWVVLQPEVGDDERARLAAWSSISFPTKPRDFADTADRIAQLDLVVTIDTSVAHLAGAMGRPVWIMLPQGPDWRWGPSADTTPWYPSARLFRQTSAGDWSNVVNEVSAALRGGG